MVAETAKSYGWELLAQQPKGTTLYTILRRVSRSGMTRIIDVILLKDNQPLKIVVRECEECAETSQSASRQGGWYKVGGCGSDAGFDLVYNLGCLIHNDGYYFYHKWL